MNILMLNHNLIEEGTYFRCFHFARHLVKRNHSVSLLTISRIRRFFPKTEYRDGVKVIQTPKGITGRIHRGAWGGADILYRIFHSLCNRYDVVMAFSHRLNVSFPFYIRRFIRKAIYISDWDDLWCEGGLLGYGEGHRLTYWIEKFLERDIRRKADGVTTTSTALYEMARKIGVPKERLRHIPSGADVDSIKPLPKKQLRQELGISVEAKVVELVSSGRSEETNLILEFFWDVVKVVDNSFLLFVGPKDSSRERLIKEYHLNGKVVETGIVPHQEISKYLAVADVLVLPLPDNLNNRVRGPIKLGDYLSAGRPIVTNDIGDVGRLFKQERIGLLAKQDLSDFAQKLIELLKNPDLCEELGKNAREVAEERYSWQIMTERLEDFILELGKIKYGKD